MFDVGEYFLYSSQGVCQVDDLCDYEMDGVNRTYYVFHPITDQKAKIMTPVDNKKVLMRPTITRNEAEEIISSFQRDGKIDWNDDKKVRNKEFADILKRGNARTNAEILKLLILKKLEAKRKEKKMPAVDDQMLTTIQQTLFNELAVVLETSVDAIASRIFSNIGCTA